MQSILEILNKTIAYFESKGIENAKLDAQILLAEVLQCKRLELFLRFEDPVIGEKLDTLREYVRRRGKREPLQHIVGKTDFFGITVKCDSRGLIPRSETEYLCEILAEKFADRTDEFSVLELGVGSGAVSLSLKNAFKKANVLGVDLSDDALMLARENAEFTGLQVEFKKSDWFLNVSGKFDLIVANPPYLSDEEVASAQPEVRDFDPQMALLSDDNGIADLRKILSCAPDFLNEGGLIACECGLGQPKILAREFADKYASIEVVEDLTRRNRFIFAQK